MALSMLPWSKYKKLDLSPFFFYFIDNIIGYFNDILPTKLEMSTAFISEIWSPYLEGGVTGSELELLPCRSEDATISGVTLIKALS